MLHGWALADQDRFAAAITYPESNFDILLSEGITPALTTRFDMGIISMPLCFEHWKTFIRAYIDHRFMNCNTMIHSSVTVTCHNITLCITFYPMTYDEHILIRNGDETYNTST
jgi:hypothetical protein